MDISVHIVITTGKERIKKSETDHDILCPKEFLISHLKSRQVKKFTGHILAFGWEGRGVNGESIQNNHYIYMRCEVFMLVNIKIMVLLRCDTKYCLVDRHQHFGGT
jgi:hypothetical protein